jgi:pyrroloquinoline-quinone synthase
LLKHPFYQAWAAGSLTREDLRDYARDYYHHVEAFPAYLAEFGLRLDESELRRAVLANLVDEKGGNSASPELSQRSHAELWLDFVEGFDGGRVYKWPPPMKEVRDLIGWFHHIASEGMPEEALAAFYAYESQVPGIAAEKDRGLRDLYGAASRTRAYFTLHQTADVYHSNVWRQQLEMLVEAKSEATERALAAAEKAAQALWTALDGIESRRQAKAAA